MSIKVKNIVKQYGEQKALNQVSFEVQKGEIVGFLGPNGAGKSTMMKILCSYLPPNEGLAEICGIDVTKDEKSSKALIGYLPEHNPLYLDMYVKEFLNFIANIHEIKNKEERIKEMIQMTGLELEQNKKIKALSKGYRQRVGLAQAMIHDPEVLILDEPTTGLDPNQIVEIRKLIKTIGSNKTVLLSTHIMQEVEALCSRVIIINRGEIVADQSVSNIKAHSNEHIVDVAFEKPFTLAILKGVDGVIEVKQINDSSFEIRCENEQTSKLIAQAALENNNMITQLNRRSATLEEVFQNLTR